MEENEAAYGLGPNNSIAGPLLDPYRFAAYTPYPHSLRDEGETLLAMGIRNEQLVHRLLEDAGTGSFVLIVLVVIGLFRQSWGPRRLLHELVLLVMAISILIATITSSMPEFRYILPLIPISSLWVGKGLAELAKWSRAVRASLPARSFPTATAVGTAVPCAALALWFAISLYGTNRNLLFRDEQPEYLDLKQAGTWIRTHSRGSVHVACSSTVITYYSTSTIHGLPVAPPAQALSYIRSIRPDFIVLDARDKLYYPELKDWIEHGIPDDQAQLVYDSGTKTRNRIEIYRWHT
jgi:hypothetical protein